MDGQTIVGIVVGALFLAGLIGALIPWIPGPLFILIGVLVWAVATQFAVIGVGLDDAARELRGGADRRAPVGRQPLGRRRRHHRRARRSPVRPPRPPHWT